MKKLYITIAIIFLMSGLSINAPAQITPDGQYSAYDTGIIALGRNQKLSVIMANTEGDVISTRVKRMTYAQSACDSGICKLLLTSQTISDPLMLNPGEAASINYAGNTTTTNESARIVVLSSSRNMRVTAQIINTDTGEVSAFMPALLIP